MAQQRILPFINPATGQQFGSIAMSCEHEVQTAVDDMRRAGQVWRKTTVAERVRALKKLQKTIIHYLGEITEVINLDTGKSRQDALIEVMITVDKLHMYLKHAPEWLKRQRVPPGLYFFKRYYTEPVPYGVVAVLGPWNLPFDLCMPPVFSALLAGNTVVLKPSEVAGATGLMMHKIFQSVPELSPYVRVVHGDGEVGAELINAGPDLIFLTGSTATGRKVARIAAETMTPFLCELGGKDPMIVLEDADIAAAAKWGVWGAFYLTGQTCMAIERCYVVSSVYERFLKVVLEETKKLKTGYSADLNSPYHFGPFTFARQRNIVEHQLNDALAKGAKIVAGANRDGMFMEPTVIVNVDHSMLLMQEESFGPILPVMKVRDEAEAVRLANDSQYGLSASVWSQNLARAARVAEQLAVGSVNINDAISHYPVSLLPFGGQKGSGNARTHGKGEVMQFTQSRSYALGQPPMALDIATHMRIPGHYHLGAAIMKLAFGVTLKQKAEPIVEAVKRAKIERPGKRLSAGAILAGMAAGILFGIVRGRRNTDD